jgi:hypothetical protein
MGDTILIKIKILNYNFKPVINYKIIKIEKPISFLTETDKKMLLKPRFIIDEKGKLTKEN